MTPRGRRRLLVVLIVIGLPTLLLTSGLWYLSSGRLGTDLERRWAAHLPGALSIGRIEVEGLTTISAQGLAWRDQQQQLITIERLTASGKVLAGRLQTLTIDGLELHLDRDGWASWRALSTALSDLLSDDPERTAPPDILLRRASLRIGDWQLRDIHLEWQAQGTSMLRASSEAGEWSLRLHRDENGAHTLDILSLPLALRQLSAAVLSLDHWGSPWRDLARQLPAMVELTDSQLQLTADGSLASTGTLSLSPEWRAIEHLNWKLNGGAGSGQCQIDLRHRLGTTAILATAQNGRHSLAIDGDPLPLAAMVAEDWPWPIAAPAALSLSNSWLRHGPDGNTEAQLDLGFPEPWRGVHALKATFSADQAPWLELASAAQRQMQLQLSLDSGHRQPLHLRLDSHEQRSAHTPAIRRSLRLRGDERPVDMATLLALPDAFGLLSGLPPALRLLLPQSLSLAGTDLRVAMPDLTGQLVMNWGDGKLETTISSAIVDWRLSPLHFEHAFLGSISGELFANASMVRARWDTLAPTPHLLAAIALYQGWGPTMVPALERALELLPSGEAMLMPGHFPAQTTVRLHDGAHAEGTARIRSDGGLQLRVREVPLDMVHTLLPEVVVGSGTVSNAEVLLARQHSAEGDWELWPERATVDLRQVSGSWLGWGGGAEAISGTFSLGRGEDGAIRPLTALLRLDHLQGIRDGWQVTLPGVRLSLEEQGAERWLATAALPEVAGELHAILHGTTWLEARPDRGELRAIGLDVVAAARAIELRDEQQVLRSLMIPDRLQATLDGAMTVSPRDGGWHLQLQDGTLSNLHWLPWVRDATFTLAGESELREQVLYNRYAGSVRAGVFSVLGSPVDAHATALRYGLEARQRERKILIDTMFFTMGEHPADDHDSEQDRRTMLALGGSIDAGGQGQLQGIIDQVDIGWLSSLPDIGLPKRLRMDGRARALVTFAFDGAETLRTSGTIIPLDVEVDLDDGDLRIENLKGRVDLLPRSWRLHAGGIDPIPEATPDSDHKDAK